MRLFTMFRRNVPTETHDENQRNAPADPQFQGVVFDDGRVAVRWLTAKRSVSVWDCMDDMLAIHGHPEYGSELSWQDSDRPELVAFFKGVMAGYPGMARQEDRHMMEQILGVLTQHTEVER